MFRLSLKGMLGTLFQSHAPDFEAHSPASAESPLKPVDEYEEERKAYLDTMLSRLASYSEQHAETTVVPDQLYHASLHGGMTELDPKRGQGLGVWFGTSLKNSAHFALARQYDPKTGQPFPGISPAIYEAKLNFKKMAIFPDEGSLYMLGIPKDGDSFELSHGVGLPLPTVADILRDSGYDGIYLQNEGTYSALQSTAIEIRKEHDPKPIYEHFPNYRELVKAYEFYF